MEYTNMSIEDFNFYCDTQLHGGMTFADAIDNIEANDNNYFYVSMCPDDLVQATQNEPEIVSMLELNPVFIDELGIYILLQP